MQILSKAVNFLTEVRVELTKVSWSTREEVLGSTMVVIVITGIMTVFIFAVDIGLSRALNFLFK